MKKKKLFCPFRNNCTGASDSLYILQHAPTGRRLSLVCVISPWPISETHSMSVARLIRNTLVRACNINLHQFVLRQREIQSNCTLCQPRWVLRRLKLWHKEINALHIHHYYQRGDYEFNWICNSTRDWSRAWLIALLKHGPVSESLHGKIANAGLRRWRKEIPQRDLQVQLFF